MHEPTVVAREQWHANVFLARRTHERGEVRLAEISVKATPVILETHGNNRSAAFIGGAP